MSQNHDFHSTALIDPKSQIGDHVKIGAYATIEEGVIIGDNTTILHHAHIGKGTLIGKNNYIHMGAVIGHEAQHRESGNVESFLKIGDNNTFREYSTVHRGATAGTSTRIGDDNSFMAFAHVGHDCEIQNRVTVTNAVLLGGHVLLENDCVLSGGSGVHQYCRIGSFAMIGGMATITKDVPPYMLVDDSEELIGSMNVIGLRRAGLTESVKREIKNAYKLLYLSGLNTAQALDAIIQKCHSKEIVHLVEFIRNSKRGILPHRNRKPLFPIISSIIPGSLWKKARPRPIG